MRRELGRENCFIWVSQETVKMDLRSGVIAIAEIVLLWIIGELGTGWYLYLAARRWAGENGSVGVRSVVDCLIRVFFERSGYSIREFRCGFWENFFLR